MFLNSINYFRGISIVFIVAGHCFGLSGWGTGTVFEKIVYNIVTGGTSLFVFISGFLFHHIFYRNFDYPKYVSAKFKNVYTPYLTMSALPIIFYVFILHKGPCNDFFFIGKDSIYYQYIRPAFLYLWTGGFITAYWYITFAMVIFICSPFFIRFIETKFALQIGLIAVLTCISMTIHRPVDNHGVFQSLVYFLPVYLLGIFASMNRESVYRLLTGKELYMITIVVFLALVEVVVFNHTGSFHKKPFEITVPDIMILQKMILCLFFMVFFNRLELINIPPLKELAKTSFAIFFIHPLILEFLNKKGFHFPVKSYGIVSWILTVCFILLGSYIVARLVKLIFKNRSRQIIGW